ncbi:MAG: hypothetical protein HKN23_09625 [Verrucomicrobiales bacterium]|nr:hypothetical protein [Verrucomicrobiales bacterium]
MKRNLTILLLTIAILIPFGINLAGWNLYTYISFGERDLILATAEGLSHNAWAERMEVQTDFGFELPEEFTKTILEHGPIEVFLERRGGAMTLFAFHWIEQDPNWDYVGLAFPWLLLLFLPVAIAAAPGFQQARRAQTEGEA